MDELVRDMEKVHFFSINFSSNVDFTAQLYDLINIV